MPNETEIFIVRMVREHIAEERKKDKRCRLLIIVFLILNLVILGIEAYNFYAWKERTERNQEVYENSMRE